MTAGPHVRSSRPHLFEIDFLRVVTALSVVAVHVLMSTDHLSGSALGLVVQDGVVSAFRFTREVFMFTSGLVLTYTYFGRPFPGRRFWSRRGLNIVLPYAAWSVFYVWVAMPEATLGQLSWHALGAILNGSASYQLYYLLVTFQFYLVLPLFLAALRRVERHLWQALAVSFVLQIALYFLDFHYLELLPSDAPAAARWFAANQDRLLPLYQFYYVLGAALALRRETFQRLAARHSRWVAPGIVGAVAALWLHYAWLVQVQHRPLGYAISIFQPVMVVYSVAIAAGLYLLGRRWAGIVTTNGGAWANRLNDLLSRGSFGIYLVHPFILAMLNALVLPQVPDAWPVGLRVFLIWLAVSAISLAFTAALAEVPVLSAVVGQNKPLPAWASFRSLRRVWLASSNPSP